jgi:hypothetical protein
MDHWDRGKVMGGGCGVCFECRVTDMKQYSAPSAPRRCNARNPFLPQRHGVRREKKTYHEGHEEHEGKTKSYRKEPSVAKGRKGAKKDFSDVFTFHACTLHAEPDTCFMSVTQHLTLNTYDSVLSLRPQSLWWLDPNCFFQRCLTLSD